MLHTKIHAFTVFRVVEIKKSGMPATKTTLILIYNIWTSSCCKLIFCKYQHAKFREGPRNINVAHTILKTDFEVWRVPFFMLTRKHEKPRNGCSHLFRTSSWQRLSVHERFCQIFWGLGVWAASSELHLSCREDRVCFASAQLASKYQPTSLIQFNN